MIGSAISLLLTACAFAAARCWVWKKRALLAEKRLDRLRESPALNVGNYPTMHITESGNVFVVHRSIVAYALLESYMD